MADIKQEIEKLISKELEMAITKFGLFRTHHEGCAVLREELEETVDKLVEAKNYYDGLWDYVKSDMHPHALDFAKIIKGELIEVIKEAIQAAAMCDKYVMSLKYGETYAVERALED